MSIAFHLIGKNLAWSLAWHVKNLGDPLLFWGCTSPSRGVSLTFDDGPGPLTASLLDTLVVMEVKATFFVCGASILRQPDGSQLIKRMVQEGHDVGVHTWSHANLSALMDLDPAERRLRLTQEITETSALIEDLTGRKPIYLRPPYGAVDSRVMDWIRVNHPEMKIVMWNSGCIDWFYHQMKAIEIPVLVNGMADAGAIICLHDNSWAEDMVSNLPQLITLLRVSQPQTTVNPQGREVIPLSQCIDPIDHS